MDRRLAPAEWWGTFTIPRGRAGRFRIGPLVLTALRLSHEWKIFREREREEAANDEEVRVDVPTDFVDVGPSADVTRYATANDTETFGIVPVLPDRAVVTRPERPLTILPHTEVTIYVGSPVWVRLLQGNDDLIGELPVSPPKEAWLGPNTREGELCYSTRTYGRLELGEVEFHPHRVLTAVAIRNSASTAFVCESVSLPVPRLSVYVSDKGRLWTEVVRLERTTDGAFAELSVEGTVPTQASQATLVSNPREPERREGMFRAFGTLFG